MNQELFSPNYRFLQINGQNLNNHFNSNNLKQTIDLGL